MGLHLPLALLLSLTNLDRPVTTVVQVQPCPADEAASFPGENASFILDQVLTQLAPKLAPGLDLATCRTLVADLVLAHSAEWILSPLPEPVASPEKDATVPLTIYAAVLGAELGVVGALVANRTPIRTSVLIAVQGIGMTEPLGWWTRALPSAPATSPDDTFSNLFTDALRERGWIVGPHDDAAARSLDARAPLGRALSDSQAAALGKLDGSELSIVGQVIVTSPGRDMVQGMMAASARVELRAIDCNSGEVIASMSETYGDITTLDLSAAAAGQKALRMAAPRGVERIWSKVVDCRAAPSVVHASAAPALGKTKRVQVVSPAPAKVADAAATATAERRALSQLVREVDRDLSTRVTDAAALQQVVNLVVDHADGWRSTPETGALTIDAGARSTWTFLVGKRELKATIATAVTVVNSRHKPKVLLLVSEGGDQQATASTWWLLPADAGELSTSAAKKGDYEYEFENPFIGELLPRGWRFAPQDSAAARQVPGLGPKPTDAQAIAAGKACGAQVVLAGTVSTSAQSDPEAQGMYIAKADVHLSLLDCKSGAVIATTDATVEGDTATRDVGQQESRWRALSVAAAQEATWFQTALLERRWAELTRAP